MVFRVSESVSSDLKMAVDEQLLINIRQPSAAVSDDTVYKAVAEIHYGHIFCSTEMYHNCETKGGGVFSMQRSEEAFRLFYDQVVSHSTPLTHTSIMPRRRRLPVRYWHCSGSDTTFYATAENACCKEYYEVIEVIIGELDKRFEQSTLTIPRRTEKRLPIDDEVLTFYRNDTIQYNTIQYNIPLFQPGIYAVYM